MIRILILDDSRGVRDHAYLYPDDSEVSYAHNLDEFRALLTGPDAQPYDIVSIDGDLGMAGGKKAGIDAAELVRERISFCGRVVLHSGRPECVVAQSKILDGCPVVACGRLKWLMTLKDLAAEIRGTDAP